MAKVFQRCYITIWGDRMLTHKHSQKAFARTNKELEGNNRVFRGAITSLSRDF